MLEVGMKAPDFTLMNQLGVNVSLSDFAGKKVVLYFYPKDNTPGCTRQACAFAGAYQGFIERDVVVIGISKDSVASHQKFAQKYNLPFVPLQDKFNAANADAPADGYWLADGVHPTPAGHELIKQAWLEAFEAMK